MSSNCQYKCALLPQGLKENSSSESYPSRTFMDLFVFLIKQRGITKTQLCDSHDRELRGDLHELRRSSNATQRHLLHRDVVEVQARLAHGDIHSLISQSAERRQKRFVLRAHQEGSLVDKEQELGEYFLLREVSKEATNQLSSKLVIISHLFAREQVYSISNRHSK